MDVERRFKNNGIIVEMPIPWHRSAGIVEEVAFFTFCLQFLNLTLLRQWDEKSDLENKDSELQKWGYSARIPIVTGGF